MGIELILGILGALLGIPGFLLAIPWMKKQIGKFLVRNVIFVFGAAGVGKTSFLRFLEEKPIPATRLSTRGIDESDRVAYPLGANERALLARAFIEFGAEHETMFRTAFREKNPIAIVFILDHAQQAESLVYARYIVQAVREMGERVTAEKIRLRCLLVLVNKADQWANNSHEIQSIIRQYELNAISSELRNITKYKPECQIIFRASCLVDPILKEYTIDGLRALESALRG